MIFDSHMHVGDFPLFNVSLDRDGLAALMGETGIETALPGGATTSVARTVAIVTASASRGDPEATLRLHTPLGATLDHLCAALDLT